MQAGELNQLIVPQRPLRTKGADGGTVDSWENMLPGAGKLWAAVEPIGGREAARSNQIIASTETRIRIRYSVPMMSLNAACRILHGAVVYNIKRVVNVKSANVEIELTCETGVNDG